MQAFIEKYFKFSENGTSFKQETVGGITSFMAMCYLIFVVPSMLADAGIPKEAAIAATLVTTIMVTLVMGLWANFPVGVAPGLGITAFFAYYICGPAGFSWQVGLGAVFISGAVFFILTVTKIREMIMNAVPLDLKLAIVVGIGAFLAFIGLKNCGIVIMDPATFVTLGHLTQPEVLLAVFCFFLTSALIVRRVTGAMIIGILATTALGIALGYTSLPTGSWFTSELPAMDKSAFQLDVPGALAHGLLSIIFTLTMVDLFDNMGVLIGLARKAGFMKPDGKIHNLNKAFITDSIGTMFSACVGTTTATSYLECAAGVSAGARTGFSAIVTASCFILALFLIPLVAIVPTYATSPILIIVGALMMQEVVNINFNKIEIAIPAFLTIIMMPLTFNIATGFGFGFISYSLIHLLSGKAEKVDWMIYVISLCFLINFVLRS